MIGTEFIKGFGLGNQLFCYVVSRCIAMERGCEFGTANQGQLGNVFHSHKGMYFMDIDLGKEITLDMVKEYNRFDDADDRLFMGNSKHDMNNGCYISGADDRIHEVSDNTLIYGNMQAESYFEKYRDNIRDWLHVKPEADSHEYTKDNLCIINMRGGEYTNHPELYLDRSYWLKAIANMQKIRSDMRFMIVTEDVESARKVLPEYECHHFDMGKDYVTIKNARYLILSNSSFAVLPAMTSETVQYIIAPKYWARHNVSDGFWSSEQNIYSFMQYQDKKGRLFSADECRVELAEYKKHSRLYARRNKRPGVLRHSGQIVRRKYLYGCFYIKKILRSFERRTGFIKTFDSLETAQSSSETSKSHSEMVQYPSETACSSSGRLQLPDVTLAAMSSVNIYETVEALKYSMRDIDFGDVVLISDKRPLFLPKGVRFSRTSKLDSIDSFNYKMTYELAEHIKTDFAMIVHADGFVIHPEKWSGDFLKYDYIGAPWPLPENDYAYRDSNGNICRVGNSVSIRSKRLMEFPQKHDIKWVPVNDGYYNEDIFICCHCKNEMEAEGLKFAPLETAVRFGREHPLPENKGIEPFSFHKWRGENAGYPRFFSMKKRFKKAVRPLLFWRKSDAWKQKHGIA